MATNWKVPKVTDLAAVLSSGVLNAATFDPGSGNAAANNNRAALVLQMQVDIVRAAILTSGRTALSATADSVPPEAVMRVLLLTVEVLANSVPQISEYVKGESMGWTIKAARDWVAAVAKGEAGSTVTPPSDPDPNFTAGPIWGDESRYGLVDLSTDGAGAFAALVAATQTFTGHGSPEGVVIAGPGAAQYQDLDSSNVYFRHGGTVGSTGWAL